MGIGFLNGASGYRVKSCQIYGVICEPFIPTPCITCEIYCASRLVIPDLTDPEQPITSAFVHLPRVFVADLYASLNLSLPEDEIANEEPLFGFTKTVEGPVRKVVSGSARDLIAILDLPFNGTIETDPSILTTGKRLNEMSSQYLYALLIVP